MTEDRKQKAFSSCGQIQVDFRGKIHLNALGTMVALLGAFAITITLVAGILSIIGGR